MTMADESWVYTYDPALKQQSTEWVQKVQGTPKKGRATKSVYKMAFTFFDYHGMIYTGVPLIFLLKFGPKFVEF